MASKPPGVLGTASNPGYSPNRQTVGFGTFHSPSISGSHTLADLEHRATQLAHSISRAIGWNETQSAAYNLVGRDSFTAGVIVGMGENLAKTVVAAVELVYTLALADYWESKQDHSFMARLRSSVFTTMSPGLGLAPMIAGHFWPGFDQKAKDAFDERTAIIEAIKHAFTHPKDFFKDLTKSQEAKAKEFVNLIEQKSLSGNFHAGVLMGELLFDLLMVIDLAVGLAKLAMAVPRLARYTEDMARLAREFRGAKLLEKKAVESAPAAPRITQAEKDALAAKMKGPAPPPAARAAPEPPPPEPVPEPVPEPAAPPPLTRDEAFQKIDDFRASKDGMEPLGDTIPKVGDGQGTVALLDLNGNPVFGVNSTLGSEADMNMARGWRSTMEDDYGWGAGKSQTLFHAEGQSLMKAYDMTGGNLPEEMNMYVDRLSCGTCQNYLPDLMDAMGVKKLNLFFKSGKDAVIQDGEYVELN